MHFSSQPAEQLEFLLTIRSGYRILCLQFQINFESIWFASGIMLKFLACMRLKFYMYKVLQYRTLQQIMEHGFLPKAVRKI